MATSTGMNTGTMTILRAINMTDTDNSGRASLIAEFEKRCDDCGEPNQQISAMLEFNAQHSLLFPAYCLQLMRRARELSRQSEFAPGEATALCNIGLAYLERGEIISASTHLRQALELFQNLKDREGIIRCLSGLGSCASLGAAFEEALVSFRQALALAKQEPVSALLADVQLRLTRCHLERGENLLALSCLERLGCTEQASAVTQAQSLLYRVIAFRNLGAADQIEALLAKAKRIADLPQCLQEALNLEQVRLWQLQRQNSAAKLELDKILNRASRMGEPLLLAECLLTLGEIWTSLDNLDSARAAFTDGLQILAETGDHVLEKSLSLALRSISCPSPQGTKHG